MLAKPNLTPGMGIWKGKTDSTHDKIKATAIKSPMRVTVREDILLADKGVHPLSPNLNGNAVGNAQNHLTVGKNFPHFFAKMIGTGGMNHPNGTVFDQNLRAVGQIKNRILIQIFNRDHGSIHGNGYGVPLFFGKEPKRQAQTDQKGDQNKIPKFDAFVHKKFPNVFPTCIRPMSA